MIKKETVVNAKVEWDTRICIVRSLLKNDLRSNVIDEEWYDGGMPLVKLKYRKNKQSITIRNILFKKNYN